MANSEKIPKTNQTKAKVLLIEDEPSLISMYQAAFRLSQYELIVAQDAQAGFSAAVQNKPVIILLDIILPPAEGAVVEFNKRVGFDIMRKLKKHQRTKSIPVVMLTNLDSPDDREISKKLGAKEYIIKANFLPRQIVKLVDKYVKS